MIKLLLSQPHTIGDTYPFLPKALLSMISSFLLIFPSKTVCSHFSIEVTSQIYVKTGGDLNRSSINPHGVPSLSISYFKLRASTNSKN